MGRASAALRTTWRWTWLEGGTSTTRLPWMCAEQDSRCPAGNVRRRAKLCSAALRGANVAAPAACRGLGGGGGGGTRGLQRRRLAETADPARAIRVVAHHDIGGHARLDDLQVHRVHDRGGESRADRHGQKGGADALARGQAEA